MIYNYSQTYFISLASITRAKINLNKHMQHSCFKVMFHMFHFKVILTLHVIMNANDAHAHDLEC
jgi:hypothetical protein